ncbi:MAG: nuclear transport factor 2 family protein [Acidimicrobiia bacterium]|nr:nuclear transport factor 2 family protein [Acidimicrobiia bacterium]
MTSDELIEIEQIRQLKYAYFRCIDQKRWDELAALFLPDIEVRYGGGAHTMTGADTVIEWLRFSMDADTFHTSHRGGHPEIELLGPDTARGVWAFDDVVIDTGFDITIRGAGFYTDEYRKVDGRWRFAVTGYKRTYEELETRDGLALTASWWNTDGVSTLG